MWRIQLGVAGALIALSGFLYLQNGRLSDRNAALDLQLQAAQGTLAAERALRDAAEEAASVLRIYLATATRQAEAADKLREAILGGDNETIETLSGSTGSAIRVLRDAQASLANCLGQPASRPVTDPTGPEAGTGNPQPG